MNFHILTCFPNLQHIVQLFRKELIQHQSLDIRSSPQQGFRTGVMMKPAPNVIGRSTAIFRGKEKRCFSGRNYNQIPGKKLKQMFPSL